MKVVSHAPLYYALVDRNGNYLIDWQAGQAAVRNYLYRHLDARLLICRDSPTAQEDCSLIATVPPQLALDQVGSLGNAQSSAAIFLIETLDALCGPVLNRGRYHYGTAHAKRLAYLSLYFAQLAELSSRDTALLILTAYLHDLGWDHADFTSSDGLIRFNRFIGGRDTIEPARLHATIAAVVAHAGWRWTRSDSDLLMQVLTAAKKLGKARRLHTWASDLRQLDQLRFGIPVDLTQLHTQSAMRLLYLSQQELILIPDETLTFLEENS